MGWGGGGSFVANFWPYFFLVSVAKIDGNVAPIFLLLVASIFFIPEGGSWLVGVYDVMKGNRTKPPEKPKEEDAAELGILSFT